LTPAELDAVADLEARVLAVDGGRLKLEWPTLRRRPGTAVEDLLWWEGDQVTGFCGLYAFGPPTIEIVGMVDPAWRRRGIGTTLLDAAVDVVGDRGLGPILLVVPGPSAGGHALAARHGAAVAHSEHALVLHQAPGSLVSDPDITLRVATGDDAPSVARLLAAGFGHRPDDLFARLMVDTGRTLLIERGGDAVGTVRITLDGKVGGVYGFAVDPVHQRQGIGRDVLARVCRQLRDEGATQIQLEVAVDNDRALDLYLSLGFARTQTEDYYELPPA
jgi:ribosomal protein S18 acetylase RimI-like enzyme